MSDMFKVEFQICPFNWVKATIHNPNGEDMEHYASSFGELFDKLDREYFLVPESSLE